MTAFLCSWVSRLMLKTTLGLDDSKHSKKRVIETSIPVERGTIPIQAVEQTGCQFLMK